MAARRYLKQMLKVSGDCGENKREI